MRQIFLSTLVAASMAACTSANKETQPQGNFKQQIANVDSSKLIVPGKSIGKLYLNQDMDSVFHIMGKADAGDGAMGKAWSIWLSKAAGTQSEDQIAVFSSYKDSTMAGKSAKEILVTAESYQTAKGLKTGLPLDSIKKQFPSLKALARYVNESEHDTLDVYDDVSSGIAFDVRSRAGKKISTAVYVHFPNKSVSNTYLSIYPGWRKL
jgi:hypothetical protein